MYADTVTDSMQRAISETNRRRGLQQAYNDEHGIDPQTIRKAVTDILAVLRPDGDGAAPGAASRWSRSRQRAGRSDLAELPHDELSRLIQHARGGDARRRHRPPLRVRRPAPRRDQGPPAASSGTPVRVQPVEHGRDAQ